MVLTGFDEMGQCLLQTRVVCIRASKESPRLRLVNDEEPISVDRLVRAEVEFCGKVIGVRCSRVWEGSSSKAVRVAQVVLLCISRNVTPNAMVMASRGGGLVSLASMSLESSAPA